MSGRRSGNRFASRRSRVVRRTVVAFVGSVLVVAAGCATPPPTMAEVLHGPGYATQRDAAIQAVHSTTVSLFPEATVRALGVEPAGSWVTTFCLEGQHNVKVQDAYRLQCRVYELTFFAWDGSFSDGQVGLQRLVAQQCSGSKESSSVKPGEKPLRGLFLNGPAYECQPVSTVFLDWAAPKSLDYEPGGDFDRACDALHASCAPGVSVPEIRKVFEGRDWAARAMIMKIYYED